MKATQIVHWPGNDTAACDDHAAKLRSIGIFMCEMIPDSTPISEDAEVLCDNCVNEAKKAGVQ
jgi:hypothetical protein